MVGLMCAFCWLQSLISDFNIVFFLVEFDCLNSGCMFFKSKENINNCYFNETKIVHH